MTDIAEAERADAERVDAGTADTAAVDVVQDGIPADLLTAFEAYERAILSNDLEALDAAFAPGAETMRGDPAGLLVGHDAISAFRGVRGGVPARTIERIEHRRLGDDVALLVSISRYVGGGTGLQTQIWQKIDGRWLITAAHVAPRAQALDRSVWRTVGDPLWQGAWEGPLVGLTVAVKDLFAIKGYRIGAGNPTFLDAARAEPNTSPAVADLLRGGGVAARHRPHRRVRLFDRGRQRALRHPAERGATRRPAWRLVERTRVRRRHRPGRCRARDRHRRIHSRAGVVPGPVGAAHHARTRAAARTAAARTEFRHDRLARPRRRHAAARGGLVPEL